MMDILEGMGFLNKVPEPTYIISVQLADYSISSLHGYSRLLHANEYGEPCDDGYDCYLFPSRTQARRIKDLSKATDIMCHLLAEGFKVSIETAEGKE